MDINRCGGRKEKCRGLREKGVNGFKGNGGSYMNVQERMK